MLAKLDDFLLARAQRFCDAFQRLTGLTKYRIEKWLWISLAMTVAMIAGQHIFNRDGVAFHLTIGPLLCIWALLYATVVDIQEKNFLSKGTIEENVWHTEDVRKPLAILSALLLLVSLLVRSPNATDLIFLDLLGVMYVGACIPRPPGKGKLRQWLESTLSGLNIWLPEPKPA
jgi:hypothetical protein